MDLIVSMTYRGDQTKVERLHRLAEQRRNYSNHRDWGDFGQPEDFGFDFGQLVCPYSRTAGNVDTAVMIILQDWASRDGLKGLCEFRKRSIEQWGHDRNLKTNKILADELQEHLKCKPSDVYITNAFPFIKPGGMRERIRMRLLRLAAGTFAAEEIAIVGPKLVLAFGRQAFGALRSLVSGCQLAYIPHPVASKTKQQRREAWINARRACPDVFRERNG